MAALVLASVSLMLLDRGASGLVDPARDAVAEVVGPAQSSVSAAVRPVVELPESFRTRGDLRAELSALQEENADLRTRVRTDDADRHRLAEYDRLTTAAADLGRAMVPARVIGVGPSQSFSGTVTIDAGTESGIRPDLTVVNADGLVGRVIRAGATTATVLLVVDPDSTVGGRIGQSMDLGFLRGRGSLGSDARLDLELVDQTVVPHREDTVVTWGSRGGNGPYVSGVPIGRVIEVYASPRETTQRAVIEPFVDFARLDVVGVVVPSGTASDRSIVEADGSLR
ncbi:rod shape-determining protein MreC [Nocardioides sp. R-C-SC26]|uniref:rod shape-determining protein MreC n=1 Tax=Nocardioides sp. R-C-SC26 TaxID=2870414 RepID=UPI001E64FC7F|nr:rod shape-determining protein MreC [Nocardioides sp. R-C-SC26]